MKQSLIEIRSNIFPLVKYCAHFYGHGQVAISCPSKAHVNNVQIGERDSEASLHCACQFLPFLVQQRAVTTGSISEMRTAFFLYCDSDNKVIRLELISTCSCLEVQSSCRRYVQTSFAVHSGCV